MIANEINTDCNDVKKNPQQARTKKKRKTMTAESVTKARQLRRDGAKYSEIKKALGIEASLTNIRLACIGRSWKYIEEPPVADGSALCRSMQSVPVDPEIAAIPRHVRWDKAQGEIDQLPHSLLLPEFNLKRDQIWSRWGI